MRAYVMTGYGTIADNVRLAERPLPTPTAKQVLIAIKAASLNPIDLKIVAGALKRVDHYAMPHPIGFDASGIVTAVGSSVSGFRVGDEVFARASRDSIGTLADAIALDAAYCALKPASVSHEQAASLPLVGLTVVQGLTDRARAQAGQSILIHAGSGGVGTFAVQYAKHLGLRVTATTSSRNADFVRALGADSVITYDTQDYRSDPARYDIVFDTLGGATTLDSFTVCKRGGTVISIVGPPDRQMADQIGASALVRIAMRFMSRKVYAQSAKTGVAYHRFLTTSDGNQLRSIAGLVEQGRIKPVIDRVFPFSDVPAAFAHLATGRARGKVVVSMT